RFAKSFVRVGACANAGEVVLAVVDDGPGIPEADRQAVLSVPFLKRTPSFPSFVGHREGSACTAATGFTPPDCHEETSPSAKSS
ncbi:hypothetical protein EN797_037550, partial [Mesorhizobium sp. M2E.F.Ca.ET.154.01.1.1]